MTEFKVQFWYKGKEQLFYGQVENDPKDILDATGVAWGAIRMWFLNRGISMPDYVRNVIYIGTSQFNWDIIPTTDSFNQK